MRFRSTEKVHKAAHSIKFEIQSSSDAAKRHGNKARGASPGLLKKAVCALEGRRKTANRLSRAPSGHSAYAETNPGAYAPGYIPVPLCGIKQRMC